MQRGGVRNVSCINIECLENCKSKQTNSKPPCLRKFRDVKIDNSIRFDPPRVDHLMSQPNQIYLLMSQQNLNSTWPITGWWVERVGSLIHLIKKLQFFFSISKKLIILLIKI